MKFSYNKLDGKCTTCAYCVSVRGCAEHPPKVDGRKGFIVVYANYKANFADKVTGYTYCSRWKPKRQPWLP